MNQVIVILLLSIITVIKSENVEYYSCDGEETKCTVHSVIVDPCPQAVDGEPCKIKRGRSATIEFTYTPQFSAQNAYGMVYWASTQGDLPFVGMNSEACSHTICPINENQRQMYRYTLDIGRKFPTKNYDIKWVLANNDDKTQKCCFITKIRLTK